MLTNPLTMVSLLGNSHSWQGLNHEITQPWEFVRGETDGLEELRRAQNEDNHKCGAQSGRLKPSLKSRVYRWPLPIQPIRIHICQGLPLEFDNLFELLPKDLRWYFHVHINYMHSGIYAMLRKQLEVEIEHLVGSDTLCRGCMNIINPRIQLRFLGHEFGR